jgi:adenylate cyclase
MVSGTDASDLAGQSSDRRKLIVVVHADVVGYSRLIGLDDVGTLARMRRLRREIIDPAVAAHGGRIVNTGGDALLMVFDSVDGAVRCALRVQQQVPGVEGDLPSDRSIRFRIGINVGDVIPDGTDVHGDVVNVAARLQAECPPGGICVSRAVRDHMQGRLDVAFEALGSLNLKNIAHPVEAFMLRVATTVGTLKSVERSLVYGGGTLPLPDKPSIAVLAFTNMSGDPEQEYFSDGIADDIITELSRNRSLFVIARNSSFTYKGRSVDIKQVARELGVRYVLEGSVRRSGSWVRVVAQLIDAGTGSHVWAERFDRALQDVFAVQDEITAAVVAAIQPAVADAELRRILRKPPENLGAWEAYQRGLWHAGKLNPDNNLEARQYFERTIALDPTFAPAYAAIALTFGWERGWYATVQSSDAPEAAKSWAQRAVQIDPTDPEAHAILAWASRAEERQQHLSLALAGNPNSPFTLWVKGAVLIHDGFPSEGRDTILTALRLSPHDPLRGFFQTLIIISYYYERNYLSALQSGQRTIALYPNHPVAYRWIAASLGQLDRKEEAYEALRLAKVTSPSNFEYYTRSCPPWFRLEDHEHMLDGLRKAGWQG